jgi:hypothetical protein
LIPRKTLHSRPAPVQFFYLSVPLKFTAQFLLVSALTAWSYEMDDGDAAVVQEAFVNPLMLPEGPMFPMDEFLTMPVQPVPLILKYVVLPLLPRLFQTP